MTPPNEIHHGLKIFSDGIKIKDDDTIFLSPNGDIKAKGLILEDTETLDYYRIEISNGKICATKL